MNKKINSDLIFLIGIFLLPFENFFFAPSSGWATITPIILAIYILFNFKLFTKEIIKFRKIIIFFIIGFILSIINYIFVGFKLVNTINTLISLGLGFVSLFSFDIYYSKNKKLDKVIKLLIISYCISIAIGIIQFITIKFNISVLYDFFHLIFKRDYLQYNRIQYFFTEPSFIGMHVFGILLPIYLITKNKKLIYFIGVFCILVFLFYSGVRILLDICIIGVILLFSYLIRYKKFKYVIGIPIIFVISIIVLYNTNYRVNSIINNGIYADGSLATRYFRIQATVYGYVKDPVHFIFGYGMGNSHIPLKAGYDDAVKTYKSTYVEEVIGLGKSDFTDDNVSYCLYTRIISEYGVILFIIATMYIINMTRNSNFKYKYSYLLITLYLYVQFESLAFYSMWIFILVMMYTKQNEITDRKDIVEKLLEFLGKKNCKLYDILSDKQILKKYIEMKKKINEFLIKTR